MSRGKHRSIKQISNASCQSFQISHPIWNSKIQGTVKSLTIKCYLGIYNYVPYNAFCGPQLWKLLETLLVGNIFNKGLCFTSLSTSSSNNSFTILMPNFMKPIETQSKSVCTQKKKKKNTDFSDFSDTLMATASSLSYIHPSLALTSVQSSHSKSRPCLLLALIFLLTSTLWPSPLCFLIPLWKASSLLLFCIAWASAKTTVRIPASVTQIQILVGSEATKKKKLLSHTTINRSALDRWHLQRIELLNKCPLDKHKQVFRTYFFN